MKRIVRSRYFIPLCYTLFFILVFLVSFYSSLPAESFRQRIIYEIERRTPFRVDIKSVDVSPIFSFKVYGVRLYKDKKPYLDIDDLKLSPSLFYLFFNKLELLFKTHLYGGEAEGSLLYSFRTKQITKAKGRVERVNIEGVSAITSLLGSGNPSIQGVLGGDFSIELDPQPRGEVVLGISDLWIKGVKLVGGFPLPDFGKLQSSFKSRIENGVTRLEELKIKGDSIDLTLSGTMPLLWEISKKGTIDLSVQLRVEGGPARAMHSLFSAFLAPQGDGSLGGKIVGTFGSPNIVKGATKAR